MPLRRASIGLVIALPAIAVAQDSARTVRGRVIDARTQLPVVAAEVALLAGRDTLARTRADDDGYFSATVSPGARVAAHFRRVGYRADSIALDAAQPLRVAMTPLGVAPVTLATSRITAPRTVSSIEARARRYGGTFIGEAEIERKAPSRTADLFYNIAGVRIEEQNGAMYLASARRVEAHPGAAAVGLRDAQMKQRGADTVGTGDPMEGVKAPGTGTSCRIRIGIDGLLMPPEFSLDEVPIGEVTGVELYKGAATVPVALASMRADTKCGLLMIWTKRGVRPPG